MRANPLFNIYEKLFGRLCSHVQRAVLSLSQKLNFVCF